MKWLPLVLVLACAGCVALPAPQIQVTAPEIHGRVVTTDGTPIAGARVHFEGDDDGGTASAADGTFVVPKHHDLVLVKVFTPCPVYDYPTPRRLPGALVVEKPGCRRTVVALRDHYAQLRRASGNLHWKGSHWKDPTVKVGDVVVAKAE
ncbi:carboxypeptidase-like regulatory domain-containing protein [Opitutus sp. ER46]|uniref:carboxypeptidase-like regulatory domain-containing protein n=1 Tax=Opitutus sp. ER46 TaxID=2161864 RepID=UPI000D2FF2F1|nr:carboxypeptidase-like regulatory domain-containing protein [Opitutus sp. ER46]PTX91630.1 hypothetical protein DB354_17310 [Opitutus sp. ER46]